MKAFYFEVNSHYGYDFWKEINQKWLKYWEMNENNLNNDSYAMLKGNFGVLRQNWDKDNFWYKENLETNEEVYKRMGIEPPFPIEASNTLYKFKVGDIIQSHISEEVQTVTNISTEGYELEDGGIIEFDKGKYWMKIDEVVSEEEVKDSKDFSEVPEAEANKSEPGAVLEGFSLIETSNTHGGKKMGNNVVSVNMRNNGYRITFATKQSDKLRRHGYQYVKLLTKKDTGEIALIFNNQSGCSVCVKKNNSESRNVTINSKEIVNHITKFYGIKSPTDYFTLEITDTIQHNLDTIIKLKLSE
jgi:hypothetical protein